MVSTAADPALTLHWYVIHVFTGQEEKIKAFLDEEVKRLHLEEQLTTVLIPKEEVVEMRDGKKKVKTRVIYPGYMYIEMLLNKNTEHLLLNTPQVINFVGPKNKPQPLRRYEIDRILGHVDRAEGGQVVEVPFRVGDAIKVIDGPFKDFTGVVRDINLEKRKVKVMVSIFGRSTPIELDFLQVSTELATS
ncbi:transcription termination/antitermination factor NusG [candidate division KSB1 bacterium]|nr:transcription termination/antitermination factor NusG [candidate division KSB1 bacterium]